MSIIPNVIATADDFGLNNSVNRAILNCFEKEYINSTSFITNTLYFEESVSLIHENSIIQNIGVHINLAEGKPLTNYIPKHWLDENGNWDVKKINKKINFLNINSKNAFINEIGAQIDKALAAKISIVHLDSHYHIHTLPCFYQLFLDTAKRYKLKLRLAQTYNEGSYIKYLYRKRINNILKRNNTAYSAYFETVDEFLTRRDKFTRAGVVEVMLHPDFDAAGELTDHYDADTMIKWLSFIEKKNNAQ